MVVLQEEKVERRGKYWWKGVERAAPPITMPRPHRPYRKSWRQSLSQVPREEEEEEEEHRLET